MLTCRLDPIANFRLNPSCPYNFQRSGCCRFGALVPIQGQSWQEMWESLRGFLCSEQCREFPLWCLVRPILCLSIWILQVLSRWDSCPCAPSTTSSSPGAQSQCFCRGWGMGLNNLQGWDWPLWHCKAFLFEWRHLRDLTNIFINGNQLMVQPCLR